MTNTLPGMGELPTPKQKKQPAKAPKETRPPEEVYVGNLLKDDFWDKQIVYLSNYINGQPPIALLHIKKAYKSYVIDGVWDVNKFEVVMYNLIRKNLYLSAVNFSKFGLKYDRGALPKMNLNEEIERTYQKQKEVSDEELKRILKLHL